MKLINIGFGNMVSANRLVAIVSPESAPIKRIIQDAKDRGTLIDATYGRRTRAVLVTDSDHVILSAVQPETVANRLSDREEDDEEELEEEEEEEEGVESGVEDALLVESESAEALLVELLFAVELAVEEAAALPSVLPFTLTSVLTLDQVTVPVDLSIVPPLSAELGTKPPANFAVTFPMLSILPSGNCFCMTSNKPSDSEVKVKLLPETSKNSSISVSLTSVVTSQTLTEPSVWNLVLSSGFLLEM